MARGSFGLRQGMRVILAMGWADFSLKYRGSVLGYLWSFLGPLVQFIVIFHIFRPFVGGDIPQYALYLFLGIIVWEHFSMTTTGCISVLHEKAGLIQKVTIPRVLLPLSVGCTTLIIFLTRFALFVTFMAFLGQMPPPESLAYLPVLLLQITALALGIGMALSAWSLLLQDIPHLWAVALQIFFWLTPIMYKYSVAAPLLTELQAAYHRLADLHLKAFLDFFIRFQPLSVVLDGARRSFLLAGGGAPSLAHIAGVTAVCLGIGAAGAAMYVRRSKYFLQEY